MVDIYDGDELGRMHESLMRMIRLKEMSEIGFNCKNDIIIDTDAYYNGYGVLDVTEYLENSFGTLLGTGYVTELEDIDLLRNEVEEDEHDRQEHTLEDEKNDIANNSYPIEIKINNYLTQKLAKKDIDFQKKKIIKLLRELEYYVDYEIYRFFNGIQIMLDKNGDLIARLSGPIYELDLITYEIIDFFKFLYKEIML